ncbi:hypothetical protein Tco_0272891 [Tanacetum coccineum]
MIEGTKKQQTYKLIIESIDVNAARYVLVLLMAVNTASLIFEVTGPGIVELEVPFSFVVVRDTGLKELPFSINLIEYSLEFERETSKSVIHIHQLILLFTSPVNDYSKNAQQKMLTLGGRGGESFWEGGDDSRVDGLHFHTCLTDILGFLEKLEWWFEQDIDKEEVRFEGDEDGDEV